MTQLIAWSFEGKVNVRDFRSPLDGKSNTEVNTVEDCTLALSGSLDKCHAQRLVVFEGLEGSRSKWEISTTSSCNCSQNWKCRVRCRNWKKE